eukprot:6211349-Pleurochrysis_carterae.AAC.4
MFPPQSGPRKDWKLSKEQIESVQTYQREKQVGSEQGREEGSANERASEQSSEREKEKGRMREEGGEGGGGEGERERERQTDRQADRERQRQRQRRSQKEEQSGTDGCQMIASAGASGSFTPLSDRMLRRFCMQMKAETTRASTLGVAWCTDACMQRTRHITVPEQVVR